MQLNGSLDQASARRMAYLLDIWSAQRGLRITDCAAEWQAPCGWEGEVLIYHLRVSQQRTSPRQQVRHGVLTAWWTYRLAYLRTNTKQNKRAFCEQTNSDQ